MKTNQHPDQLIIETTIRIHTREGTDFTDEKADQIIEIIEKLRNDFEDMLRQEMNETGLNKLFRPSFFD